jgi:SAM-dependent methyltransferase
LSESYSRSARVYDLIYGDEHTARIKDYAAEAKELDAIIRARNPSARTLLDVACGTGVHLALLRGRYSVEGADLSPQMLAVAARRLPGVPLHQADMRSLALGRTYDVVTCLFSSIGYVTDADDLVTAIGRLAQHLSAGGVLIIDGWVRPDAWQDGYRADPESGSDGVTDVVRLAATRREGQITTLDMHHLVRTAAGIEHVAERHVMRLVPTSEHVAAFEAAGLRTEVLPQSMPGRDRIVGLRPR